MSGVPVVVVDKGGFPVRQVDSDAPLLTVASNGLGAPITFSDNGAPFVVEGISPPQPVWETFFIIAGSNPFGWGFAKPPLVSATLGSITNEPYSDSELISFFEAPDDSRIIACFSGDIADSLNGHTFEINGKVLAVIQGAEYDAANNWTMMFLESYWMVEGDAYVVHRTAV